MSDETKKIETKPETKSESGGEFGINPKTGRPMTFKEYADQMVGNLVRSINYEDDDEKPK